MLRENRSVVSTFGAGQVEAQGTGEAERHQFLLLAVDARRDRRRAMRPLRASAAQAGARRLRTRPPRLCPRPSAQPQAAIRAPRLRRHPPVRLGPGHFEDQIGSDLRQFLAQVPELVGGVGNVDVVGGEQVFVGGAAALDLLGFGLGGGDLGLQRGDVGAGAADLRVERIRFGLGQIQDRVTSSYSFSSWSMVPSRVAIWVGHCASRTWSVNARTIGASTRSMMPRSVDSEA